MLCLLTAAIKGRRPKPGGKGKTLKPLIEDDVGDAGVGSVADASADGNGQTLAVAFARGLVPRVGCTLTTNVAKQQSDKDYSEQTNDYSEARRRPARCAVNEYVDASALRPTDRQPKTTWPPCRQQKTQTEPET